MAKKKRKKAVAKTESKDWLCGRPLTLQENHVLQWILHSEEVDLEALLQEAVDAVEEDASGASPHPEKVATELSFLLEEIVSEQKFHAVSPFEDCQMSLGLRIDEGTSYEGRPLGNGDLIVPLIECLFDCIWYTEIAKVIVAAKYK